MKPTTAITIFPTPGMPCVTRWTNRGAGAGALGFTALVWRSMR